MTPLFFFWGPRVGKSEAARLARLSLLAQQERDYRAMLNQARAAEEGWMKYVLSSGSFITNPQAIGAAMAEHNIAKYGYCPAHPFLNNAMSTYQVTRIFTDPAELEIFEQACRNTNVAFSQHPTAMPQIGRVVAIHATLTDLGRVQHEIEHLYQLRDKELAKGLNAMEANPRNMQGAPCLAENQCAATGERGGAGEKFAATIFPKKNRCYESITQVEIKGPNSGERYTVRVWRSLAQLEQDEGKQIQRWASRLNELIDAMTYEGRKRGVDEAWIIRNLETFQQGNEAIPRIVAVEVNDKDGCGKLLYPDWS